MFVPVYVVTDRRMFKGYEAIINTREVVSVEAHEWDQGHSPLSASIHLKDGRELTVSVHGGHHTSDPAERSKWFAEFFREFQDAATGVPENPWERWAAELKEKHKPSK